MLDFHKLISQIQEVCSETALAADDQSRTLRAALTAWEDAGNCAKEFSAKLNKSKDSANWPVAVPFEPPGQMIPVDAITTPYSVVATDGSQIMPTQHEVISCYLINIGEVVIHYGSGEEPLLTSTPHLFHRREDLYPLLDQRRMHIDDALISAERALLEISTARDTALRLKAQGRDVLCIVDGTITPWGIDRTSEAYQRSYIERYQAVLDSFNAAAVPVCGYVSHSRSSELVNALRIWLCPYSVSQCKTFCGHLNEEEYPCSLIWPMTDRQLSAGKLEPGCRTAAFGSNVSWSLILEPRNQVVFMYLDTGLECARIELPHWVFDDPVRREFALAAILSQAEKGVGYPVALAEAHNLAVVRQADRARFFDLLTQHLASAGVDSVRVSPKELRKRKSIV